MPEDGEKPMQTALTGEEDGGMIEGTNKNNTPLEYAVPIARAVAPLADTTGIDLDPCASETSDLASYNIREDGGLRYDWSKHATVFVNHPYADPTPWLKRAVESRHDCEVIVTLSKGDPSTDWFQDYLTKADAMCFPDTRISFTGQDSGAKFPNVFGAFGTVPDRLEELFAEWGWTPHNWRSDDE